MPATPDEARDLGERTDAFRAQARRRVAERVPLAIGIFIGCILLSEAFEGSAYPERWPVLAAVHAAFAGIALGCLLAVRRRPQSSVPAMATVVSLAGLGIVLYHAAVGAVAELCLLVLAALLSTVVVILPWGWRAQALACVGGAASFPLALLWHGELLGHRWGIVPAGPPSISLAFLSVLVAMSVFGAELIERYLRADFRLTEVLREREAHLARAKEAAEAANRDKSDFLARMSHEIRTPMNVIFGMTDMALDSALSAQQRHWLHRSRSAAGTLLVLVNDILDFSKIESGKLRLVTRPLALRAWLEETLEPLAWLAREKGLDLSWQADEDVPDALTGDPDRLRQVVVNLVANAIKFTDRGRVEVRVARDSCDEVAAVRLLFTVTDTGVGIPAVQRAAIFDAFVQADPDARGHEGGTGLGLAICSRLVELMGGRIWVESEVGAGSRFHFTTTLRPGSGEGTGDPRRAA